MTSRNKKMPRGTGKLIRLKRQWESYPVPMPKELFDTCLADGFTPAGEFDLSMPLTAREKLDPKVPPGADARIATFIYFYRDEPVDAEEETQS